MARLFFLLILSSQLIFAYEYSQSMKYHITKGCLKGGGSKEFCNCQTKAIENSIPESEISNFQQELVKLYKGGSPENLPDKHIKAMRKMATCIGL